jgi:ceramide glucosyltransferase
MGVDIGILLLAKDMALLNSAARPNASRIVELSNLPLAILGLLSIALVLWQWRAAAGHPLGRRRQVAPGAAAVTVLKPLKGCDAETEACLVSWLNQDHAGPVQVLCGVSTPDDPACALIRRLIELHPGRDLTLLITAERLGTNGKVSSLAQLSRQARHEVLVVSDADVRVPPDLLRQLTFELGGTANALVCCLYRLANASTTAMQWEAVSINSDFWSQVLQARAFGPLDFALGATMAFSRKTLEDAGGFEALVDQLADDFQLGNRLVRQGGEVRLSTVVVECWESPRGWGEVWRHQLRWARTIRVCRPLPYFFSLLANGTLWPLLWLVFSGPWVNGPNWAWPAGIAGLVLRAATAWDQQRRLDGGSGRRAPWWMPWFKDLAQVALWAAAFLGNAVEWRGERYRVRRGGRLERSERLGMGD